MARPLSNDLRERVVAAVSRVGVAALSTAETFQRRLPGLFGLLGSFVVDGS